MVVLLSLRLKNRAVHCVRNYLGNYRATHLIADMRMAQILAVIGMAGFIVYASVAWNFFCAAGNAAVWLLRCCWVSRCDDFNQKSNLATEDTEDTEKDAPHISVCADISVTSVFSVANGFRFHAVQICADCLLFMLRWQQFPFHPRESFPLYRLLLLGFQ
jgi:hypothetical protein